MDQRTLRWQVPDAANPAEKILESRYAQLLKWGELLARGDRELAQEIVHDLYLQLTLTKPDLSDVSNLDGYLYTCLKHIYLSKLTRSSREAIQFVSIEDYDSIQSALEDKQLDGSLETQNELRRICCYSVWRKEFSKSFSYFILHFFHGYFHREIAELACLPISAVYNKLKSSRTELKSHLNGSAKLRVAKTEAPPAPILLWTPVTPAELFKELRQTILDARNSNCLLEEELLSYYSPSGRGPLPCAILAHIVSCERCLAVVDRHLRRPTLKDRDFLDGFDRSLSTSSGHEEKADKQNFRAALERRRRRIYEHRPAALSISVNGRIVAFHDVQGEHSILSARIEHPESARFVEVFSEQDIRLILLPIRGLPPENPGTLIQEALLSDERRLALKLSFDGLGLHGEVTYFDPTLAFALAEESTEPLPSSTLEERTDHSSRSGVQELVGKPSVFKAITRFLGDLRPSLAIAWALMLACIVISAGYLTYRHMRAPLNAEAIMNRSIRVEAMSLQGKTEHQVLHFEEISSDGHSIQGTVDLWRDGDSARRIRRLYDANHRLIASEWQKKDGKRGSYTAANGSASDEDRQLIASEFWKLDVSPRAFHVLAEGQMQARVTADGYELTAAVNDEQRPQVISATLILNRHFQPAGEILRMRSSSVMREIRFMQETYESKPSSDVPDSVFRSTSLDGSPAKGQGRHSSIVRNNGKRFSGTDAQLVQLQIGVLYRLNQLGADTGEPIEVKRVDGSIRISGTVANELRQREILSALGSLPSRQLLDVRIASQSDMRIPFAASHQTVSPTTSVYNIPKTEGAADAAIRKYLEAKGLEGKQLDFAVAQFSRDALEHAQRALQHAYALDRLGNAFTPEELRSAAPVAQQEWANMVSRHASGLQGELQMLRDQLSEIASIPKPSAPPRHALTVGSTEAFAHAAKQLLRMTQVLSRNVSNAFASSPSQAANQDNEHLVSDAAYSIPLEQAEAIVKFSSRLAQAGQDVHAGQQSSASLR